MMLQIMQFVEERCGSAFLRNKIYDFRLVDDKMGENRYIYSHRRTIKEGPEPYLETRILRRFGTPK